VLRLQTYEYGNGQSLAFRFLCCNRVADDRVITRTAGRIFNQGGRGERAPARGKRWRPEAVGTGMRTAYAAPRGTDGGIYEINLPERKVY